MNTNKDLNSPAMKNIYAGRIKSREKLLNSSSGGAFTVLTDFFLERGNAIISCIYSYQEKEAVFKIIQSKEERDFARGSKYMQSKPHDIFNNAKQWLLDNPNKMILFLGMGCQADGFRKFIEHIGLRDRVYIVDIICHGSPSPKIWKEYISMLEKRYSGVHSDLKFKDKRNGWKKPTAVVTISGKEISLKKYVNIFYNQCALRPSCYECRYATIDRKTDITIGDFWHIEETMPEFYDYYGTSLFLIHTPNGQKLFEEVKENLDYMESDKRKCWQANLEAPTPKSEKREKFWKDYQKRGIKYIEKKYGSRSFVNKLKNKLYMICTHKLDM